MLALLRILAAVVDVAVVLGVTRLLVAWGVSPWVGVVVWLSTIAVGAALKGSIGKAAFGLRVEAPSTRHFLVRETLGKAVSLATLGVGFLVAFTRDGRGLHDWIAGTRVERDARGMHVELLVGLVIGLGVGGGYVLSIRHNEGTVPEPARVSEGDTFLVKVSEKVHGVMTISCYDSADRMTSQGSGFLTDSSGEGITALHVLGECFRAGAELGDGRLFDVLEVTGVSETADLASFRIGRVLAGRTVKPEGLPFLEVSGSEGLKVGSRIAAIGTPKGLRNTVTDGVVSALRDWDGVRVVQLSAPISPGSSGGPILDVHAKVVAVATSQVSKGQNLNFGVAIEATRALTQFKRPVAVRELPWAIRSLREVSTAR